MYVLGVNAGPATFHDSSACVIDGDGRVLSFIEEERLTRVRHAPGPLPRRAVEHCLRIAGLAPDDIDVVAVGWDVPRMSARWGTEWKYGHAEEFLTSLGFDSSTRLPDLQFFGHHRAHAASAFYASGYERAGVLVMDGNGEDESVSIYAAERGKPLIRKQRWPRVSSIGYMYDAVSNWLGLGLLNAGKTMGLAAYGRNSGAASPGWISAGGGQLSSVLGDDDLLGYRKLMPMWDQVIAEFAGQGTPSHGAETLNEDAVAVAVAWAAQSNVEAVVPWLVEEARSLSGSDSVCIAGGVGLNCAANGRLAGPVYVPPVPHDAGVALGAAWLIAPPTSRETLVPYTGGDPGALSSGDASGFRIAALDSEAVANLLVAGMTGAVCRGDSEVGPRALCHRSILSSPVSASSKTRVNNIKGREQWRPFGPVTNLPPSASSPWWNDTGVLERYMVGAASMTSVGLRDIPGVAHVDETTRPQRLTAADEPFVDELLTQLGAFGHPRVLINTSLNGRGEPLVQTADEALRCALRIGLDFIVINDDLITLSTEARRINA
ncbi:carbamoyltransferase C-terminal domain-containing protein [Promicromonospora sp. MS192]|uniref:carbamoyltransferase C-terminal domain-containing protein n=1 Tax=Promicromonospora sp. MS192 TaxID=3412684 RepID=UPI003C2BA538